MPVIKVYMTFPGPIVGVRISPKHADEDLITVRIRYFVSLPLFRIRFHTHSCFLGPTHALTARSEAMMMRNLGSASSAAAAGFFANRDRRLESRALFCSISNLERDAERQLIIADTQSGAEFLELPR
jgi:hypothetical protein